MNINTIRIFITILLVILAIILLYLIAKKINIVTMIIFLFSLVGIDYFYMGLSIQGAPIMIIMMAFSIIILLKNARIKNIALMFFITGMATNFFDFLTVPVLTLGMPLTIYFLLKQKEKELTTKQIVITFAKNCISWAIGYALAWISKWIIIDILYGKNVINSAFQQIRYRGGASIQEVKYLDTLKYNIIYVNIYSYAALMLTICAYIIINYKKISKKEGKVNTQKLLQNSIPYILILMISVIWYAVLKVHSYQHCFFTYKNMLLIMLGISILTIKAIDSIIQKEVEK